MAKKTRFNINLLRLTPKGVAFMLFIFVAVFGISRCTRQNKIKQQINTTARALDKAIEDRDNYVKTSAYFIAQKKLDSLTYVNKTMYDSVCNAYGERLDKEYNLGTFYNARELSKLNQQLAPFFKNWDPDEYYAEFVKNNFPLTSSMTLKVLEDLVMLTGLPADKIKDDFGIHFIEGSYLAGFFDERRQGRLDEYNHKRALADAYVARTEVQKEAMAAERAKHKKEIAEMDRITRKMAELKHKVVNKPVWEKDDPDMKELFKLNTRYELLQTQLVSALDAAAHTADSLYLDANGGFGEPGDLNFVGVKDFAPIKIIYWNYALQIANLERLVEDNAEVAEAELRRLTDKENMLQRELQELQHKL